MKYNPKVSSSRRKCRKAHFAAPSNVRRTLMSMHVPKELREKGFPKSFPVHSADEVMIMRGGGKKTLESFYPNSSGNQTQTVKVESVYRKRMSVYLARIEKSKKNGSTTPIPVHASNLMLKKPTKIGPAKYREALKARNLAKHKGESSKGKGKNMAEVD